MYYFDFLNQGKSRDAKKRNCTRLTVEWKIHSFMLCFISNLSENSVSQKCWIKAIIEANFVKSTYLQTLNFNWRKLDPTWNKYTIFQVMDKKKKHFLSNFHKQLFRSLVLKSHFKAKVYSGINLDKTVINLWILYIKKNTKQFPWKLFHICEVSRGKPSHSGIGDISMQVQVNSHLQSPIF